MMAMKNLPRTRWRRAVAACLLVAAVLSLAWFLIPKPQLLDGVSFSRRVLDREGQPLRITLSDDHKFRLRTPLEEISPRIIEATLLHEDRYYFRHPGVNPIALARAAWHALPGRARRGGASTITMQLARLRYGLHTQTLSGKLWQIARCLQIERHYSKDEILEAYFNLAPYGGNIEGVGAASWVYFGKGPERVTTAEAATLSVIPQSPARRAPRTDAPNPRLASAQARLHRSLGGDPLGDGIDVRPTAPSKLLAPHFALQILSRRDAGHTLRTTLDLRLQRLLENCIREHVRAQASKGVRNAAAMLVDHRTMEVLAQVGSADFFDDDIDGQVDLTRARRSPGSALKPLLYAMALDRGLIHPATMMIDMPRSFGAFNPENSDREFAGPIPARDALAHSRNIPAVELAARLSAPSPYEFLVRCGLSFPEEESHYGLALPLGGAEVAMQDLVALYAMLANGGLMRPLRYATSDPDAPGTRVLGAEAAFLVLDMLDGTPRPDPYRDTMPGVAWKTGTSSGFRDAWTIAVFDHFVLAVWVGNSDGRPNHTFVGRTCAAPLAFKILDALRSRDLARPSPRQPPPGANLRRVELCATSGGFPTPHCPNRKSGWFIPGISPIASCDIHRQVILDAATGLRLPHDDGSRPTIRAVFEFWPEELARIFDRAGLPRCPPPPWLDPENPDSLAREGKPPRITSPRADVRYAIRPDDAPDRGLALQADTDAGVKKLFWFSGSSFLGSCLPGEPLRWTPPPGQHQLLALDDHGRSATCRVTIEAAP